MKNPLRSDYHTGVILLVLSAITFSTAGLFTKGVEAGAWDIIFWRGLFAAAFTTFWCLRARSFRRNTTGIGAPGLAVGLVGALGTAAFIPAFKLTSIANVALIYAASPLIAAALAWLAIGEKTSARTMAGSLFALAGVAVIMSGSLGSLNIEGDLLALWMTCAMAAIMVIYRKYPDTPTPGPAVLQSLLLLPVALLIGSPFAIATGEILILAGFGLLFAIASVTLAEGAKRVSSAQTALLSSLETPLAPLFAFLLFTEVPSSATVLGGTIIFLAVLLSIQRRSRTLAAHS